jgi:hypothetical protein
MVSNHLKHFESVQIFLNRLNRRLALCVGADSSGPQVPPMWHDGVPPAPARRPRVTASRGAARQSGPDPPSTPPSLLRPHGALITNPPSISSPRCHPPHPHLKATGATLENVSLASPSSNRPTRPPRPPCFLSKSSHRRDAAAFDSCKKHDCQHPLR